MGNNAVQILCVFVIWYLLPRVGRRGLYLIGMSTLFAILLIVGFMGIPSGNNIKIAWASGAFLILFNVVYALTIGPSAYCLVAEVPSTRLRVQTAGLARTVYLIAGIGANFLAAPVLNPLSWNLHGKGGFVWCGFTFVGFVWAYFRLPETKGLAPAELDMLFEENVSARKFQQVARERWPVRSASDPE